MEALSPVRIEATLEGVDRPGALAGGHRGRLLLLLDLRDHHLGRQHEARDGRGVLERRLRHLGRVDDPRLEQVLHLLGGRVEADVAALLLELLEDDRALDPRVRDDLAGGLLERALDDAHADLDVAGLLELLDRVLRAEERHAAGRHRSYRVRRLDQEDLFVEPASRTMSSFSSTACGAPSRATWSMARATSSVVVT